MTFHPYMVWSVFLALRSPQNPCNWCQAQAHENGFKKLLVFQPPFGLNNDYMGNLKGGVPLLMGVGRGRSPFAAHANCGFSDPPHALWWVPEAFLLL